MARYKKERYPRLESMVNWDERQGHRFWGMCEEGNFDDGEEDMELERLVKMAADEVIAWLDGM